MDENFVTLTIVLTSFDAAACSQVGLQQEEDEVEEFQLIEKLQRLGINAGSVLWEHPAVHCRRKLLTSIVHLHHLKKTSQIATQQALPQVTSRRPRKQATTPASPSS